MPVFSETTDSKLFEELSNLINIVKVSTKEGSFAKKYPALYKLYSDVAVRTRKGNETFKNTESEK